VSEPRYEHLAFSIDEYRARERRVVEEMDRRGIDVLYVMNPANINYLTGFESVWYAPEGPYGVVVCRRQGGITFLDFKWHENHVLNAAHWDETFFFDDASAVDTVLRTFSDRGWVNGRVGMEWHGAATASPVVRALADGLSKRGAEVVPGDWVVDHARLVKSPAEIECVRRAAAIGDAAFEQLLEFVRPGMTEIEVEARLALAMAELGGERGAIQTMVSAGSDLRQGHGAPSRRPIERGDVMGIDMCGAFKRYHVDLCRTFAIGEDVPAVREILDYTARSIELVTEGVRRGDPLDVAQKIADDYVFARFSPEDVWWVGGYAIGIAFPPSWVGHTYLSNDTSTGAHEQFTWEPGYVSNYENILYTAEHGGASYIDSLIMTESGLEILSKLPRTLTVIEV
jgi:Xaa-Pro aminopeptidase